MLKNGASGWIVLTGCAELVKVRVAGVKPVELTVTLIVPGVVVDCITIRAFPLKTFLAVALKGSLLFQSPLAIPKLLPAPVMANET